MNQVKLALNICTYKREQILRKNLDVLKESEFFNLSNSHFYNKLEIFVIDNASELSLEGDSNLHLFHNPNTGGSGGFQRGIEEIRKHNDFTHVIFMDDDVSFEMSAFYILFDFLENENAEYLNRPIAGRMLDKDNPNIQWTAAENWNSGEIQHVEFLRDITDLTNPYIPGKAIYDADADYGGFWFCCYPFSFVKENDLIPFFLHCDDVEYGLRCGETPIIIEGVHVWHETWEKKISPVIQYYDCRNSRFLNRMQGNYSNICEELQEVKKEIHKAHMEGDVVREFILIKAFNDSFKSLEWLKRKENDGHHRKLIRMFRKRTGFEKMILLVVNKVFRQWVFYSLNSRIV